MSSFNRTLLEADAPMAEIVARELQRQNDCIELIASENIASRAVLEAQGSVITNKTVEGYPGARYHGGAAVVDDMERLGIERACQLFECQYANLQPHSGSQANQTVFHALLKPGDRVLSMDLSAGGHLSHGAAVNQSGRFYDSRNYTVRRQDGRIDMFEVAQLAEQHRPKLIIAGGSAYPRVIDFERFRQVADSVGAKLLVDMAHIAGLVAGGAHPSPVRHADVVTSTTNKTLRGARGGLILSADVALGRKLDSALFPGVQGSAHLHTMAAKTVCLGEALQLDFQNYATAVVDNARTLAAGLMGRGYDVVTGGTDTHLVLIDLRRHALTGKHAAEHLESAGINANKNMVPFDTAKPWITSGLRLGSAAGTTRGFGVGEFAEIADLIADVLDDAAAANEAPSSTIRQHVADICVRFPLYSNP
jgi:glycine hydroxymethyltransferase